MAAYQAACDQVLRIKQCYPKESVKELGYRLWWAFLSSMFVEEESLFTYQDRHHFWTTVVRMLMEDSHRQKPSSRYVAFLEEKLNKRLSSLALPWIIKASE